MAKIVITSMRAKVYTFIYIKQIANLSKIEIQLILFYLYRRYSSTHLNMKRTGIQNITVRRRNEPYWQGKVIIISRQETKRSSVK